MGGGGCVCTLFDFKAYEAGSRRIRGTPHKQKWVWLSPTPSISEILDQALKFVLLLLCSGFLSGRTMRDEVGDEIELAAKYQIPDYSSIQPNVIIKWILNSTRSVADIDRARVLEPDSDSRLLEFNGPMGSHTLTILDPNPGDSGIYTAMVDSILFDENVCDSMLSCDDIYIPLLSHTAITRPIAYEVMVQGER